MSPATVAARLRQQAAELIEIADGLDRGMPTPAREPGRDRFFLDTSRAMKISRRSSSWLYAGRTSACEENEENEESDGSPLSNCPRVGQR
jgi:hypothetical protein